MERTLVVIKPDAVQRGIIGEIITRFERVGLKIIGAKMFVASKELLDDHYPSKRKEFIVGMGKKSLKNYEDLGLDVVKEFGTDDPEEIGTRIRDWLVKFMSSGPVFAMVIEGPHAVEIVRKITGPTLPNVAPPGTIRGDYSFDSSYLGNTQKRPIKNLIHASGDITEAAFEVGLWFSESEMFDYETIHQAHMNK